MTGVRRWQLMTLLVAPLAYLACSSFGSSGEEARDAGGAEDAGVIEEDDLDAEVVGATSKIPEGGKVVFVSSAAVGGNLGGRAGADEKCRSYARQGRLPGTYAAFLRDNQTGASARFSKQRWYRLDGTLVFDDVPASNNARAPIDVNQGGTRSVLGKAWTGEDGDNAGRATCNGWTDQSFNRKGIVGDIKDAASWANAVEQSCIVAARLYCFEE